MSKTDTSLALFTYLEIDNHASRTLFLFHGTGADEKDLIPLVEPFATHYNIVSLRGNVSEHGLLRFFIRHPDGTFDQENIRHEATKVNEFISAWCAVKKISFTDCSFLGFSNGANMIVATLFLFPKLIYKAVLLHPMLPFTPDSLDLKEKKVLITYGKNDPMVPRSHSEKLVDLLTQAQANVTTVTHEGGHELRTLELEALQNFLLNT